MYTEIIAVCSQIHTKHINAAVWAERRIIYKDPGVPRSKHSPSRL